MAPFLKKKKKKKRPSLVVANLHPELRTDSASESVLGQSLMVQRSQLIPPGPSSLQWELLNLTNIY